MVEALSASIIVGVVVSAIACRLVMATGLLDVPDRARKAHGRATPTSGGLGLAIGFAFAVLTFVASAAGELQAKLSDDDLRRLAYVTTFAIVFLALGLCDDARPLGPRAKLIVLALLSAGSALAVGVVTDLPLGPSTRLELGVAIGLLGSALFVFTLVNTVNFMDGANGLALGTTAIGLVALGAIVLAMGSIGISALCFCAAAAILGFLIWNFPRGRLFAGDSGALFSGSLAALASLAAVQEVGLSPIIPPIVFFPLLADVLLTLAWRVSKRRQVLDGHREHLYQIAIRGGLTHAQISLVYWAAAALCGAIAFVVTFAPEMPGNAIGAPALALAGLALASLVISSVLRRFAVARGMSEV